MSFFSTSEDIASLQRKVPLIILVVLLFVFIVLGRLLYLQVYLGTKYQTLSTQISIREEELRARRGLILDRNGKVLADNRPYFEIVLIPQYLRDREKTLDALTRLIPIPRDMILEKLRQAKKEAPFLPVVIVEDAPYDWVSKIREYDRSEYDEDTPFMLEGVEVRTSPLRLYLYPEIFSHALGYLKEIDQATLDKYDSKYPDRYSLGDLIGASGIEVAYDQVLRGLDGVKARIVDARGREIRENEEVELLEERGSFPPKDGNHLVTTLDFDAQTAAAEAFGDRRGAVVALEPQTGEILVLFSSPGFNGNRITKNIDHDYWKMLNRHEDKYLYNRAIMATYPPGSTYKIVGAFAGLDSGALDANTHFNCSGGMQFGNRYFQCWRKGGHGSMSLVPGLTQSCDVFFYNVGLKVGVDGLYQHAHLLGLGEKTGIEIPFEQAGLIPSAAWKMKRYKKPWIESETLSIAIGQGYDLVTPLQNARMIAMIANGGRFLTPHLGKSYLNSQHKKIKDITMPVGKPSINPDKLKLIQEGLIQVVHGSGTATRLRASSYKIAGKTGTAQVIGYESRVAKSERTKDHALFVCYAPYDDPQIAVSVIVENGGHGGSEAAPVAQAVIDAYLGQENRRTGE